MYFFIVYVLLAVVVGASASNKNRSAVGWAALSLAISPLVAFLLLFISGENIKKCPQCAEKVKPEALVCKHCSYKFETPAPVPVTIWDSKE